MAKRHSFADLLGSSCLVQSARRCRLHTHLAIEFSIRLQSQLPGGELRGLKLLPDVIARANLHLVRSLTVECRVWKLAVVLLDVKLNELPDAGCRVECVEE